MERERIYCYAGSCCAVFLVVFILIMTSLTQVQFNEMAFARPWGQSIDQTTVYEQGVHMLGFWNSLVVFPADVVSLQMENLSVFSKKEGDDAGTTLTIDLHLQYRLDPEHLSDLFDIGGETGYITQIESVATEQIKNEATSFNADAYLDNRRAIEEHLKEKLAAVIKEQFAETIVTNVQLQRVEFPQTFYSRKLDVALQEIQNEIEGFNQNVSNIRKETERDVKALEDQARAITEKAKADAELVEKIAENEFQKEVGLAREQGMRTLAATLGADRDQKDFLNLNYLIQILNNPGKQKKFVNFGDLPPAVTLL